MLDAGFLLEVVALRFIGAGDGDRGVELRREHFHQLRPVGIAGGAGDGKVELHVLVHAIAACGHGGVDHAWRLGRVTAPGMIDDQAAMIRAALALCEATGDAAYQADAERLAWAAQTAFADGHGGFYSTAVDASDVPLTRPRTAADNATPAGNGIMAEVLARLYHLTGNTAWRDQARNVLTAFSGQPDQLAGMPTLLAAADLLEAAATVVIAGPDVSDFEQAALTSPDPAVVVLRAAGTDDLPAAHPAHGKVDFGSETVAFVCRGSVCGLPITDPAALSKALRTRL